jgi:DNA-binding phage protein
MQTHLQEMAHDDTKAFVANLKIVCAERGSIQRVAAGAEMSRVWLSKILNGHVIPTLDDAIKISEAAGLSLSEMLKSPEAFVKKHGKKFAVTA